MYLKKKVEKFFKRNTYAADWLYSHYRSDIEKTVSRNSDELSAKDSIKSVEHLGKFKTSIEKDGVPFWSYDLNATESRMYGIHGSLFGEIKDRAVYFPSTEHGLILHNKNWTDTEQTSRAACVTFGEFRKEILRRYYKTPIFCVGPYIHYANDYYDDKTMCEIKAKIGKNLLVFPTHGTDDSKITFSEKNFLDKISSIKDKFDSVTVCVYWWNLNDCIVKALEKIGCHIVSAGYREDPNFLSRLKAIIDLSDLAIGDSIGTHIGYCLDRGKPFSYFDGNTQKQDFVHIDNEDDAFVALHTDQLKKVFLDATSIGEAQAEAARYYWGTDQIKTKEQLYQMYLITKKITVDCKGRKSKYPEYAQKLLLETSDLDASQRQLLYESLI